MTYETNLKACQVWRSLSSLIAVAVCGYFSLGTSCDSSAMEETASIALRLEAGQTSAVVMVHAEGGDLLRLHFDQYLTVRRNGVELQPPGESPPGAHVAVGGTFCEIDAAPEPGEPPPPSGTLCTSDEFMGPVLYEVAREETTEALDVIVTGTLVGETSCGDVPPDRFGIVLEAEPTP